MPDHNTDADSVRSLNLKNSEPRAAGWTTSSLADTLAEFTTKLNFDMLPEEVIHQGTRIVRDTLGTMLAGATIPEIQNLVQFSARLSGPGNSSLMGCSHSCNPLFAALVNGTGAVTLELDEGNQFAINHPSVHIFPVALALAEDHKLSGKELLTAFIAGYEVAVRLGRATRLKWPVHPFGTHATVGAAACASKLLGLDVTRTAGALDMAAGMCIASSQTAANSGAAVRNLVTGLSNHNGLLAAMLIGAGFTGEPGAMNVVFGSILGESFDEQGVGTDLGSEFYITRNYFKIHACSRWNHAPIEAMANLMEKAAFDVQDVDQITVWTYDPATRLSWNAPVNGYAAKHSIPYNVAVRLVRGSNDLTAYSDEVVSDPPVQATAQKVKVLEDPKLTAMLPDVRPARVEVKLLSGEIFTETVERPMGGFDRPLSDQELIEKFNQLAGMILRPSAISSLEHMLQHLPDLEDVGMLSPLLRGARP
ncbi:MAG: MmgE/PrpD family protein [Desulfobacterales bacterium]|jgi:2-methylcitrate dehydratase PrpD